jgi:uncharacterized protein (TIGR02246 family)
MNTVRTRYMMNARMKTKNTVRGKRAAGMKSKLGGITLGVIILVAAPSSRSGEADARTASLDSQNSMTIEQNKTKNEAAVRELIDGFTKAIRTKDIDRIMAVFAPDVVSFDLGPPLQHGGGDAFTQRWHELFDSYQDAIHYEVRDLDIAAGDDVAFSHSLNRISGTLKNGQENDRWLRWTACYRKINGRWLIVHEQVSVPVDVRNGKAVLDLKP